MQKCVCSLQHIAHLMPLNNGDGNECNIDDNINMGSHIQLKCGGMHLQRYKIYRLLSFFIIVFAIIVYTKIEWKSIPNVKSDLFRSGMCIISYYRKTSRLWHIISSLTRDCKFYGGCYTFHLIVILLFVMHNINRSWRRSGIRSQRFVRAANSLPCLSGRQNERK
jgi:hypothetical protein